jgi:NAD+ synthase
VHTRASEIAAWLRHRVSAAGAQGLLFQLTPDLGSAVLGRLCQRAIPERTVAVIFNADARGHLDAAQLANHLQLPTITVDLTAPAHELRRALDRATSQLPVGHTTHHGEAGSPEVFVEVGSRLRMTALHFLARRLNSLLAGSANRSMLTIGAFTRFGDAGVDLLPLGGVGHEDVLALAQDLDVGPVQGSGADSVAPAGDADALTFNYADVERYLAGGPDAVAPATALRIERLIRASEQKLAAPAIPEFD